MLNPESFRLSTQTTLIKHHKTERCLVQRLLRGAEPPKNLDPELLRKVNNLVDKIQTGSRYSRAVAASFSSTVTGPSSRAVVNPPSSRRVTPYPQRNNRFSYSSSYGTTNAVAPPAFHRGNLSAPVSAITQVPFGPHAHLIPAGPPTGPIGMLHAGAFQFQQPPPGYAIQLSLHHGAHIDQIKQQEGSNLQGSYCVDQNGIQWLIRAHHRPWNVQNTLPAPRDDARQSQTQTGDMHTQESRFTTPDSASSSNFFLDLPSSSSSRTSASPVVAADRGLSLFNNDAVYRNTQAPATVAETFLALPSGSAAPVFAASSTVETSYRPADAGGDRSLVFPNNDTVYGKAQTTSDISAWLSEGLNDFASPLRDATGPSSGGAFPSPAAVDGGDRGLLSMLNDDVVDDNIQFSASGYPQWLLDLETPSCSS